MHFFVLISHYSPTNRLLSLNRKWRLRWRRLLRRLERQTLVWSSLTIWVVVPKAQRLFRSWKKKTHRLLLPIRVWTRHLCQSRQRMGRWSSWWMNLQTFQRNKRVHSIVFSWSHNQRQSLERTIWEKLERLPFDLSHLRRFIQLLFSRVTNYWIETKGDFAVRGGSLAGVFRS